MKIALLYIAVTHGAKTLDFASRFASSYHDHPPGIEHKIIACCNGGPPSDELATVFAGMNAAFWPRKNDSGYDLSAYMEAASFVAKDYDMLLCLGESNYFWKSGWLKRMADVWSKYGEGMYSPFATHVIRAHLQTTAFAVSPRLLLDYPLPINDRPSRMEFEHGERALWRRLRKKGYPVKLVTWSGDWSPGQWRLPKNGLWAGDQSDLLWHSNHSDRFREADDRRKRSWTASANRPFR